MNENQFNSLLALIVPQIVAKIVENSNISDIDAINKFYSSRLYSELADEESKLWHYSPLLLYTMYQDELLTGTYYYPEEA